MAIVFTQYLRPDGRKTKTEIDRPSDIEALAERIRECGGCFESEHLDTGGVGHVSLTVAYLGDDIGIQICRNGPGVPAAVDQLVKDVAGKLHLTDET
jgi:hypothetical protein